MKLMRYISLIGAIAILSLLTSCNNGHIVYQDQYMLPEAQWQQDSVKTFSFEVTTPGQTVSLYYFMRHNLDYPYANIYLKDQITGPDGKVVNEGMKQFFLAHPETGRPFGAGLADMRDNTLLAYEKVNLTKPGKYTVKVQQYMRQQVLTGVAAIGLLVMDTK